ncbi:MAG: protein kinase [Chitinispirillaceae bacterium]|nr:protein kinase [Chitinispirillaceae bacterium]
MSHIIKKTLARNNVAEVILAEYADEIHSFNVMVKTAFLDIKGTALARLNAAKHLNHPGTLEIIDFGVCTNSKPQKHYISTRHVPGVTLTQVLSRFDNMDRKIPHSLVMHVITSLCNTLEFIHDFYGSKKDKEMMYHGAICPDNVFITFDGDVCFIDSGVADQLKYRFTGESIVENGRTIYHHPDIAMGSSVKRHHEIYSMGILLFRMLVEEKSFVRFFEGGGSRNLKHVKKLIPSIPSAIEKIIDRATRFRGLSKFAKYEQIADVYHDLLDYAIASSVKFEKTITSLLLYVLFPERTDHSPVKDQIQVQNALECIQKSNDNSLRTFLTEKFNINEMTNSISDQYQILNMNVSTDLSQVNYYGPETDSRLINPIHAETVKIETISDQNVQKLQVQSPDNQQVTETGRLIEADAVATNQHAVTKNEKKHVFTDLQPVKVVLPQKSVQAFSKIIKARSIIDTHVIEIPSETGKNVHPQNKSFERGDKNRIKASTTDSFSVLQQKNGYPKKDKIIESFSKILKKESISV